MKLRPALLSVSLLLAVSSVLASEYVVQPGDTVSTIAEEQLGDRAQWSEIARLNHLDPPYKIAVGQRLTLPSPLDLALRPRDQNATERSITQRIPAWAWGWIPVVLAVLWLFTSLCVRGGCWFSLVEVSFKRCLTLSFILALLSLVSLASLAALRWIVGERGADNVVTACAAVVLVVVYFSGGALLTKLVLQCKWRSVITVFFMATFAAHLLAMLAVIALALSMPSLLSTQEMWEFLKKLVSGE